MYIFLIHYGHFNIIVAELSAWDSWPAVWPTANSNDAVIIRRHFSAMILLHCDSWFIFQSPESTLPKGRCHMCFYTLCGHACASTCSQHLPCWCWPRAAEGVSFSEARVKQLRVPGMGAGDRSGALQEQVLFTTKLFLSPTWCALKRTED